MNDYFPRMKLQPNPSCDDSNCVKRQQEYKVRISNLVVETESNKPEEKPVVHEDNLYGMGDIKSDGVIEPLSPHIDIHVFGVW